MLLSRITASQRQRPSSIQFNYLLYLEAHKKARFRLESSPSSHNHFYSNSYFSYMPYISI